MFFDLSPLVAALNRKHRISVSGLTGSSLSAFVYDLSQFIKPIVLLVPGDAVERLTEQLPALNLRTARVDRRCPFFTPADIFITTPEFFNEKIMVKEEIAFSAGQPVDLAHLINRLLASGYERQDLCREPGEFAVRGGIIDIAGDDSEPVRIELFGDAVESIRQFNIQTQRSVVPLERFSLLLANPRRKSALSDLLPPLSVMVSRQEIDSKFKTILLKNCGLAGLNVADQPVEQLAGSEFFFKISSPRLYFGDLKALRQDLECGDYRYIFLVNRPNRVERIKAVLPEIEIRTVALTEGFMDEDRRTVYLTEHEVWGEIRRRPQSFRGLFIDDLKGLKDMDFVVHSDFGIGQFRGLCVMEFEGKKIECLRLDYAEGGKVFLPVERVNLLERYIGATDHPPRLSRLGSEIWLKTKKKVKRATEKLAFDLIQLYTRRQQASGIAFAPDGPEMADLEAAFPYEETEDQIKAINDVKRDMESSRPQERLICGDVGYGKTEIALRAAFKAVLSGYQVALLCPTTLLAFQHYQTFKNRLADFPVRVEMVSRFRSREDLKTILADLARKRVDIVIGTQRLLQPDVEIPNLGLLIIDEEQRFGVMQKEKFKHWRLGLDIIYLTATPIPRTLYMALTGIKDISNIHTPPAGRRDIETRIMYWDDEEIQRIINHEIKRGGQVFFVHNRIQSLAIIRSRLARLLPDNPIAVIHGRMRPAVSERRMLDFLAGRFPLLLSTAIVESGLDMPRVNTIIVNDAHQFGLADLHQLRGRVGRSGLQAYAYFIVPETRCLTETAQQRLSALNSYAALGSGFRLALRDMEIRGIGDLLGREQSGAMDSVGYHHYLKILSASVNELRGVRTSLEPVLSLKIEAYIPSAYIESAYERTALYKRLLDIESHYELETIRAEIKDRFGRYPLEVENLLRLSAIRLRAREIGATEVIQRGDRIVYTKGNETLEQAPFDDQSSSHL